MSEATVGRHIVWQVTRDGSELHVIPINDLAQHQTSRRCYCNPVYTVTDNLKETLFTVWVHNLAS